MPAIRSADQIVFSDRVTAFKVENNENFYQAGIRCQCGNFASYCVDVYTQAERPYNLGTTWLTKRLFSCGDHYAELAMLEVLAL